MKVIQSQAKPSSRISNKTNGKANPIYCLFTAFDAFGDAPSNPSQTILESLPKSIKLRKSKVTLDLHTLLLPSIGDRSWRLFRRALDMVPADKPVCIILTGVAAHRSTIHVERFALNVRDYRIPDNAGKQPKGDRIIEDGPEGLRTDAEVEYVVERLRKKGIPAEVSNHAGSFVCNEIFYRAMWACDQGKRKNRVVFVHVPGPSLFGAKLRKQNLPKFEGRTRGTDNQIAILREAVLDITSILAEELIEEQAQRRAKA